MPKAFTRDRDRMGGLRQLIRIDAALQRSDGITLREAADELGTCTKTARRYVTFIRDELGFPVEIVPSAALRGGTAYRYAWRFGSVFSKGVADRIESRANVCKNA